MYKETKSMSEYQEPIQVNLGCDGHAGLELPW